MRFTLFGLFDDSASKLLNADDSQISEALAYDNGDFFRWEKQIPNIQCKGIWPKDDASQVAKLLAISDRLQNFLYDEENNQRQGLTADQLGRLQKLFLATQKSLEAAKKVCESSNSYTNPDFAKKGITRSDIETTMGYQIVRTNRRTGEPIKEESGVGVTGKIAKAIATNALSLEAVTTAYQIEDKKNENGRKDRVDSDLSSVSFRSSRG